jgi:hypothetical protein
MLIGEDRPKAVDETLVPEWSSGRVLPLWETNAVPQAGSVSWDRAMSDRGLGAAQANGCYTGKGLLPSARRLRATHRRTET